MALSWIKRAKRPLSVDDLVGAGEYRKAIELLRKQFSQRYPSTTERQRYAELLVRAGRGAEAVPVLLGIADEQERYGFPDKALEALRCAAVIDPEQAEVKERLEAIPAAPAPAPAVAPPLDKEAEPEASDTWGAALDGAFRVEGELQESVEGAEEVPAGVEAEAGVALDDAPEFAVLDADDPDRREARSSGRTRSLRATGGSSSSWRTRARSPRPASRWSPASSVRTSPSRPRVRTTERSPRGASGWTRASLATRGRRRGRG